jgi:hypothetical protein
LKEDVMRRSAIFALLLLPAALSPAFGVDKPAPPGFSWRKLPVANASVIVPDDWHVRETSRRLRYLLQASPDPFPESGTPRVELSVLIKRNLRAGRADVVARTVVTANAERTVPAATVSEHEEGPFAGWSVIVEGRDAAGAPIRRAITAIANRETNTLYRFSFTAPADHWETLWQQGSMAMEHFSLDDEY